MDRRRRAGLVLSVILGAICPAGGMAAAAGAQSAPADSASGLFLTEVEFRTLPPGADPIALAHGFIDPLSLRVQLDGSLLAEGRDYRLRGRSGLVIPLRDWELLRQGGQEGVAGPGLVICSYRFQPLLLPPRLDLRPLATGPQEEDLPAAEADPGQADLSADQTGRLEVSGSKTVQVSSGTRRDMTVDQNLRLNVNGQLTPDISVRAFLSDDNLPVVPEGNTEQLRDIDKVLVQLQGRRWSSTLGDFVAERKGTVFGDYRRKLQGVSLESRPGRQRIELLAGAPRGRYRTLQIRGQEANQGPYYLGSGSAGANLFIVAGSERVTLDGEALTRGADRDYVIDYVRGTVTFTYRRLITADSAIRIEYEEGEGPYARTVVGAGAGSEVGLPGLGGAGRLGFRITREQDDPARLRTGELGEEDQAILAAAGDDALLAVASGVTASPDTTGLYDRIETPAGPIYVHAPEGGPFNVEFRYLGPGKGEYDLDFLSQTGSQVYVHRGPGLGSYSPGRALDLPTRHSIMTMDAALGDTSGAHLELEWNVSELDRNRLSDLDDGDNSGTALRIGGGLGERELRLGGRQLGRIDLAGFLTDRGESFVPFQLHKDVHVYEEWGLGSRARREGFLDEAERELLAASTWNSGARGSRAGFTLERGSLRHGAGLRADRTAWSGSWRLGRLTGEHRWRESTAADRIDPLDIHRNQRGHSLGMGLGWLRPTVHHRTERWEDSARSGLAAAGFALETYGWGLKGNHQRVATWSLDFTRGLADSLSGGSWRRERDSRTSKLTVGTGQLAGMRVVGEGTLRRTKTPGLQDQTTRLANLNLSGRWDRTGSDFSLGYRVDNSRAEVLDRQILFVGERQGDFDQDGRYLGEGLGDYDLVLAGTDSLVATTGVRADVNWRQNFDFLGRDRWYGSWSLLTLAAAEGRSTTDEVGELLALRRTALFDPAATVLGDVTLSEEFTLLRHLRRIDLRGKFDYRQTLDRQYAAHPERRLQRSWQTRGSLTLAESGALQWRWQRQQENRFSAEEATSVRRSYQVGTSLYELGVTYSPHPAVRLALQGEHLNRADAVSGVEQREYALRPALRRQLRRDTTLQAEIRASRVVSDEPGGVLRPWFFPQPGTNVDGSLRLAWEPSKFMSVSASWFARRQGERGWQHDVRVESTARF